MADGERDRVLFDPGAGQIEITTGGRSVAVAGIADQVTFEAETPDGEMARALWLTQNQATVLTRMTRYIIEKVRIRAESKQTLEELLPDLEALWPGAVE